MLVFLFPGQGSQKRGMGADLFDAVPEYKQLEPKVDELLGYSLRELCLEDSDRLKDTRFTQPSLYVVSALHYYRAVAAGRAPDAVAGHSLGEYDALLAAGSFDLLTGLRLVQRRAELMAAATGGGMMAVLDLTPERIFNVLHAERIEAVDIANYNSPGQTVISGPREALERAEKPLQAAGAKMCVHLPVSAAFHSRYVDQASRQFAAFLEDFSFDAPRVPVIANVTGRPYPTANPTLTIRRLLAKQIAQPVQWNQTIRYLLRAGATRFEELGPGNVLTRLVEQVKAAA